MMRTSGWRPGRTAARSTARLAAVLLALGAAPGARAQESPRPSLPGHTFVSTDLIPDAFVRSYVRSSLGYAEATSIDYPPLVVGGNTLDALNGSLSYTILNIDYQGALRSWMAVRVGGVLVSRIGTQTSTLVQEGVTVTQGYMFEWLARLRQTPTTSLCGSLGFANQTVTLVDVKQFAEDVANGVPNARLLDYLPVVRSDAGLRFAWAASPTFGVTLLGETSYGDAPRRHERTSWAWNVGASVDYDAGPSHGIPVGAALGYRLTSLPGVSVPDNGNSSQTVLRIAYTGAHDVVAVDMLGIFNRQNSLATAIWAGGTAFSMRFYF
jgi:hypothetical protein